MTLMPNATPFDALLLVSFGGPEGPDDVLPFLENVTRGRGVPRERLLAVAEHYQRFGGVSPINAQCRALIEALAEDFAQAGLDLPIYWGNRNWQPMLADTLATMTRDGVRHAAVFVTAAYSSYSSCRQYREDLAAALASPQVRDAVADSGNRPPRLAKLRAYFNHPGFAMPMARAALTALADLPERVRNTSELLFVTHSIPTANAETAGPDGDAYVRQHRDLARWIADEIARETGVSRPWELVFCSRSGSPTVPWLEPDVDDYLTSSHAAGVPGAVLVPIGFISDHMEVIYDLDVQAMDTARGLDMPVVRAATVGTDPDFVALIRGLVLERAAVESGQQVARRSVGGLGPSHDVCPVGCCRNLRADRPAAAGADADVHADAETAADADADAAGDTGQAGVPRTGGAA
jgi:ferrochelatase